MAVATKHNPTVSWRTIASNVYQLTRETVDSPATYRIAVSPVDQNDLGAGQKQIGFYFTDYLGNPTTIIGVGTDYIDVSDDFKTGYCPVSGRMGIVHKSAYKGNSLYLTADVFRHLHPLAFENNNKYAMSVLFANDPNPRRFEFANTNTPSITNYHGVQGDGSKLWEDYGEDPQFDLITVDSENVLWTRQEKPIVNLVDGLIDSIVYDLSDSYSGWIVLRK